MLSRRILRRLHILEWQHYKYFKNISNDTQVALKFLKQPDVSLREKISVIHYLKFTDSYPDNDFCSNHELLGELLSTPEQSFLDYSSISDMTAEDIYYLVQTYTDNLKISHFKDLFSRIANIMQENRDTSQVKVIFAAYTQIAKNLLVHFPDTRDTNYDLSVTQKFVSDFHDSFTVGQLATHYYVSRMLTKNYHFEDSGEVSYILKNKHYLFPVEYFYFLQMLVTQYMHFEGDSAHYQNSGKFKEKSLNIENPVFKVLQDIDQHSLLAVKSRFSIEIGELKAEDWLLKSGFTDFVTQFPNISRDLSHIYFGAMNSNFKFLDFVNTVPDLIKLSQFNEIEDFFLTLRTLKEKYFKTQLTFKSAFREYIQDHFPEVYCRHLKIIESHHQKYRKYHFDATELFVLRHTGVLLILVRMLYPNAMMCKFLQYVRQRDPDNELNFDYESSLALHQESISLIIDILTEVIKCPVTGPEDIRFTTKHYNTFVNDLFQLHRISSHFQLFKPYLSHTDFEKLMIIDSRICIRM